MPTLGIDSYSDLVFADDYFARKLHTMVWDDSNDPQRSKALFEATIRMDRLNFRGARFDEDQVLQWPRDSGVVPDDIKKANCEIAYAILDGVDSDFEYENLAVSSDGLSSARVGYDRSSVPEHFAAGIPSLLGWLLLKPYLADNNRIKLLRV
jgi:hypothetical protein